MNLITKCTNCKQEVVLGTGHICGAGDLYCHPCTILLFPEENIINTVELFSGTKSFSKIAQNCGYKTLTIDNERRLNPDLCIDILQMLPNIFTEQIDILWASPPCTAFSVASIGRHWTKAEPVNIPKSSTAELGLKLLDKTIELISILKPIEWYIENPRAMMRMIIDALFKKYGITGYRRVTVTYCQYGDTRQKPTDIWTNNMHWNPKPICAPGSSCHVSAPRGSRTGTQGMKNATDRGAIPPQLFVEIFAKNSMPILSTTQTQINHFLNTNNPNTENRG